MSGDGGSAQRTDRASFEYDGERVILTFRRALARPPAAVWRALTEPAQLEHWFPTTIDGERAAGARLRFEHRDLDLAAIDGAMLACLPDRLMALRWGEDVLRFALEPAADDATLLTLTVTVDALGRAARDAAGWHVCLDSLADRLDGRAPPGSAGDRWRAVHAGYVERFGPQAATIGPPPQWEATHASQPAGFAIVAGERRCMM